MKRLVIDSVYVLIAQSSAIFIPLMIVPLIASEYLVGDVASFLFSLGFIQFFQLIFDFGLSTFGVKKARDLNYEVKALSELLAVVNGAKLLSAILLFILVMIVSGFSKHDFIFIALLSVPAVIFQSLIPYWLFQSIGKMKNVAIVNVISRVTLLLLSFVFAMSSFDFVFIILSNFLCWALAFIVTIRLLAKNNIQVGVSFELSQIKSFFNEIWIFYLSRLAVASYSYVNILFIGFLFVKEMLAAYGVAELIFKLIISVANAVNQALYPLIVKTKSIKLFFTTVSLVFFSVVFVVVLVNVNAESLISLLYGPQYLNATEYLFAFSILALINSMSIMFGFPAAGLIGNYKYVNASSMIAATIYFLSILLFFSADLISVLAFIYSLILAESTCLFYRIFGLVRLLKERNFKIV